MARLRLADHLRPEELQRRYRQSSEPVERTHWQVLWLLSQGYGSQVIAEVTGYSVIWVRVLVRRYNEQGPSGMEDQRHFNPGQPRLLSPAFERELSF